MMLLWLRRQIPLFSGASRGEQINASREPRSKLEAYPWHGTLGLQRQSNFSGNLVPLYSRTDERSLKGCARLYWSIARPNQTQPWPFVKAPRKIFVSHTAAPRTSE